MSKRKSRRSRRQRKQQPTQSQTPAAQTTAGASSGTPSYTSRFDEIPTDYSHVVGDLRRIALVGGVLIAALIALSFFL